MAETNRAKQGINYLPVNLSDWVGSHVPLEVFSSFDCFDCKIRSLLSRVFSQSIMNLMFYVRTLVMLFAAIFHVANVTILISDGNTTVWYRKERHMIILKVGSYSAYFLYNHKNNKALTRNIRVRGYFQFIVSHMIGRYCRKCCRKAEIQLLKWVNGF